VVDRIVFLGDQYHSTPSSTSRCSDSGSNSLTGSAPPGATSSRLSAITTPRRQNAHRRTRCRSIGIRSRSSTSPRYRQRRSVPAVLPRPNSVPWLPPRRSRMRHEVVCHATFNGARYENGFYAKEALDPDAVPQKRIISGHIHTPASSARSGIRAVRAGRPSRTRTSSEPFGSRMTPLAAWAFSIRPRAPGASGSYRHRGRRGPERSKNCSSAKVKLATASSSTSRAPGLVRAAQARPRRAAAQHPLQHVLHRPALREGPRERRRRGRVPEALRRLPDQARHLEGRAAKMVEERVHLA
jgi:hypothetical protein